MNAMSEHKGARLGIKHLGIGAKIGAGFAVVLLILAVSSAMAWLAFSQVSGALNRYSVLVTNAGIFRDLDLTITRYRGHAREYIYSNEEATADLAVKDGEALRTLIATGLGRVNNVERRALLEDMAKQEQAYTKDFTRALASNKEQTKVMADLETVGQQITDGISKVFAHAVKIENAEIGGASAEAQRVNFVMRLDAGRRLNTHDDAAGKSAERGLGDLRQALARLDEVTKGSDISATVAAQAALVERWQTAFRRAAVLDAEQLSMLNGAMRQSGMALAAAAENAKETNLAEQATIEQRALAATASGDSLVTICGLAGLAIGIVLAWLIGRAISRPVVGMCAAMRALAGGNRTVAIPGVGRRSATAWRRRSACARRMSVPRSRPRLRARPACCASPTHSRPASRAWSRQSPRRRARCSRPRRR
jgi:hypothetical protein